MFKSRYFGYFLKICAKTRLAFLNKLKQRSGEDFAYFAAIANKALIIREFVSTSSNSFCSSIMKRRFDNLAFFSSSGN